MAVYSIDFSLPVKPGATLSSPNGHGWHPALINIRNVADRVIDAGDPRCWTILEAVAILYSRPTVARGQGSGRRG